MKKKVVRDGKYSGKIQLPAKYIGKVLEVVIEVKSPTLIPAKKEVSEQSAPSYVCEQFNVRLGICEKYPDIEVSQEMCEKCKQKSG
jgi:hypothetical protein